jgi:transposase
MLKHRTKHDDEFKKNAVKLSYANPKPESTIAEALNCGELNVQLSQEIYGSRRQDANSYNEEAIKALRLENAELKMERDMLKKAAAYFVKF